MIEASHADLESLHRGGVAQVRGNRDAGALSLAHDRFHERWGELLIDLQAIHTACEQLGPEARDQHACSWSKRWRFASSLVWSATGSSPTLEDVGVAG